MSWETVTLNDLQADEPRAITDGPFGSNLARQHYTDSGPRVVRLQNIGDGVFLDARAHISDDHFRSLRGHEVRAGDLLIASLGEVLPRACLAPQWLGPAIVKADCIRVRLRTDVDPRWVMYSMQRPAIRRWADHQLHGVGRPRLGLKVIRNIPVPLPPPREQRRIVDILEDHISRIDAADRYVSSALQRLDGIAESTLRGLLAHSSNDRALGELLEIPLSNGRSVPTRDDGFPVLRLTALKDRGVDLGERKGGDWLRADARRFLVSRGDFLVARGNGSLRLVGRGSLVRDNPDEVAYPDTAIRVRTAREVMTPEYLDVVWNSTRTRVQIEGMARTTAGIYKVNQKQLAAVRLPAPSVADQGRIVGRMAEIDEQAQRSREALGQARVRAAVLRRALLAAAFSGRLTGRHTDQEQIEELVDE